MFPVHSIVPLKELYVLLLIGSYVLLLIGSLSDWFVPNVDSVVDDVSPVVKTLVTVGLGSTNIEVYYLQMIRSAFKQERNRLIRIY